jgi:prolyl-tRNA editing enzyme YbaK/EbsC (Cys-tRNA(Pro) deacylase)
MSASVQRVIEAAAAAGLDIDVVEFPEGTRTAEAAAEAVGCEVGQIVKSMIFAVGDEREIVLALTSGSNTVDGARLARLAGADACHRADPEEVRAVSGFAIGGVAPIGHLNPLRTWIDPHLLDFDVIWAAAGTPRHVFAVDPVKLQELTGAAKADFVT